MGSLFSTGGALRPLRPHQDRALEALRASLAAGHKRPLLQAPTGFGKTLTAAHIVQRALDRGKRVIFTVPALSLVDQTVDAFAREGINHVGVMQGGHWLTDREQPVQVASVQTLARRTIPAADLVLIDEAHLMFDSVFKWMARAEWQHVPFIGLSATPWSRGLGKHFDDLIIASTTQELIDEGYLSKFVVFAPSSPDLSSVSTVAGEFHQGELATAVNTTQLVGDVIETWLARGEDRQTLCYGVNRAHAEHLQQRFVEAGVAAEYIDCFTERADREAIFGRFRAGQTRVICNVGTLTTGIDLDVRCIVDAKPTRSEILYVQTIGRGLRTAPGKDRLIVLDHAGNCLRLGLVTDIHHDRLHTGDARHAPETERKKREVLPVLCEACKCVMPPVAKLCPQCGALREAKSEVIHADGELVELGARPAERRSPTYQEKLIFLGELRFISGAKGYSEGWQSHKFREKFGHWPDQSLKFRAEPREPSLKTRQWLKSRQIAFAKAREARHGNV